jgi:beta-galactosidase
MRQTLQAIQAHIDRQTAGLAGRVVQSLDHDWRFHQGEATGAELVGFDDAGWVALNVPHDYSITGEFSEKHPSSQSGGWVQAGVGWYRKRLHVATMVRGQKVFVIFDGVSMNSQVWLNGRFLGLRPSGHTPFHYDITAFLDPGDAAPNILAVRVDTSLQPYSRFYCGSGINRHVRLLITNPLHIEPLGVTVNLAHVDAAKAEIEISTDIRVERYAETDWDLFRDPAKNNTVSKCCLLTTRVLDQQGKVCAEATEVCEMPHFSRQRLEQRLALPAPRLWSPEDPYLYLVQSQLSVEGQIIDETRTPLGVRTVTVDTVNGLQLNGRSIKLKGVCLHQDAGVFGAAVPLKKWVRQLRLVQGMGCNAVRTSHHPFPAEFYDCCDVLGLLVVDEAFDEWQMGWTRGQAEQPFGKNTYGYHLYFEQWHETDLRAMIRRDRHHPSVIMWSIGNEIPEQYYAAGAAVSRRLVRICKEEDPTRPVTLGTEGNGKLPILDAFMEPLDVKGYNYVDLKNGAAFYDAIRRVHPDWVLLGTETGYDPAHWQAILRDPAVLGQFLWAGYDYLGESACLTPDSPPGNWASPSPLTVCRRPASS